MCARTRLPARGATGACARPGALPRAPQTCRAAVGRRAGFRRRGGQGCGGGRRAARARALVKRLRMRPAGVVSKKDIGARTTCAHRRAPSAGRGRGDAAPRVRMRSTADCTDGQQAAGSAARPPGLVPGGGQPAWMLPVRDVLPHASLHRQSAAHPLGTSPAAIRRPPGRLPLPALAACSCRLRRARCRAGIMRGAGRPPGDMQAGPPRAPRAASCCVS